jgi:hypothetical protein
MRRFSGGLELLPPGLEPATWLVGVVPAGAVWAGVFDGLVVALRLLLLALVGLAGVLEPLALLLLLEGASLLAWGAEELWTAVPLLLLLPLPPFAAGAAAGLGAGTGVGSGLVGGVSAGCCVGALVGPGLLGGAAAAVLADTWGLEGPDAVGPGADAVDWGGTCAEVDD